MKNQKRKLRNRSFVGIIPVYQKTRKLVCLTGKGSKLKFPIKENLSSGEIGEFIQNTTKSNGEVERIGAFMFKLDGVRYSICMFGFIVEPRKDNVSYHNIKNVSFDDFCNSDNLDFLTEMIRSWLLILHKKDIFPKKLKKLRRTA